MQPKHEVRTKLLWVFQSILSQSTFMQDFAKDYELGSSLKTYAKVKGVYKI